MFLISGVLIFKLYWLFLALLFFHCISVLSDCKWQSMLSSLQLALIWILIVIYCRGVTDAKLKLRLAHQRLNIVQNRWNVVYWWPVMFQHVFDATIADGLIVLSRTFLNDIRVQYRCQNVELECDEWILLWERYAKSEIAIWVRRLIRPLHLHNVRVQLFGMVDGVPYVVFFVGWSQQVNEVELFYLVQFLPQSF